MSKYWNSQGIVTIIIIIIIIIILNMHFFFLFFASLRKKLFWSLKWLENRDHLLQSELSNMKVSFEI